MIIYDRLWQTMKERGISQYRLIKYYGFSSGQIGRLKKNAYVSTHTLDVLCTILDCKVEDIMEFRMDTAFNPNLGIIPKDSPLSVVPDNIDDGTQASAPADPESDDEPSPATDK